ncbi:MAG: BatA domain-containing protein [Verrucomicrobiales bacterium]
MTFLQPFILWGLPLLLLPVVIHLINRLRHRPQPWAAMRFLQTATRSSVSHAKLRQFLILLFRVLAVAMLIIFLSRPLAGGWLGWALSPAPDVIVIILDRSASMEANVPGGTVSRREQAIQLLSESAKTFDGSSHLVLIDSATRQPQELADSEALKSLASIGATQTSADMPQLMQVAYNWMVENKSGAAEIWVASDLQRSNWRADDPRWTSVMAQIAALPQKVKVRLLAFNQAPANNVVLSLEEAVIRSRGGASELVASVDIQRSDVSSDPLLVYSEINGSRSENPVKMDGQYLRWRTATPFNPGTGEGHGSFVLPADSNPLDNEVFFTLGKEVKASPLVVSSDSMTARFLHLASSRFDDASGPDGKILPPSEAGAADWSAASLIVWQAPLPSKATADRLLQFISEGGTVVFFPPASNDSGTFSGFAWGGTEDAPANSLFPIERWSQDEGPLARTEEGLAIPVTQAEIYRRQKISGGKFILASFADNTPFLVRQTVGRGRFYFCASLPRPEWSSLGEGPILVPMLQRMSQEGVRRLQADAYVECGEFRPNENLASWVSVDAPGKKNPRLNAGVYQIQGRLVAVNRPRTEDEPEMLGVPETKALLAAVPTQLLMEKDASRDRLQGEIWRVFVFAMLIFLLAEGWLILPNKSNGKQAEEPLGAGETGIREALA